jgi:methyl-accepting chemotaxis protein
MNPRLPDPWLARTALPEGLAVPEPVPDLLGQPERQSGLWGGWLRLTTPPLTGRLLATREREALRRSRLLSTLQLTAVILMAVLVPRGFLPVLDPGTLLGIAGFAIIVLASMVLNRRGHVLAAGSLFTGGLALAIAGSQLATPSGKIGFEDLAGYDLLVIPLIVASILLPSRASIILWAASASFVVLDLGLAQHGASLDAYLPSGLPAFARVYPVAVYPVVLTAVVAVISWLAARSVDRALHEVDRTAELERAYALMAEQKRRLEEAIGAIQQVHARVANGDLGARAPTPSGDPLLLLAVSLNLTLDRLARSTMSAVNLEAMEQEMAILSRYIAELAQADLRHPAPEQRLRRLAPLARSLDQLRSGILQAIEYTRAMVEQIGTENQAIGQQVRRLPPAGPADPDLIGQIQREVEEVHAATASLYQYLSQFL